MPAAIASRTSCSAWAIGCGPALDGVTRADSESCLPSLSRVWCLRQTAGQSRLLLGRQVLSVVAPPAVKHARPRKVRDMRRSVEGQCELLGVGIAGQRVCVTRVAYPATPVGHLAKVRVAGSNPVVRSTHRPRSGVDSAPPCRPLGQLRHVRTPRQPRARRASSPFISSSAWPSKRCP
jgi:hypothetical protein